MAPAKDAKNLANLAKLSPAERKHLAKLRQQKQIGNFKMPDSPEPKKGKGKGKGKDKRVWSPCPLLPGVPTVPPPHVPQPWELKRSHDITEKEEQKDDIPQPTFAREMQSAGTPPRTAPESVMDITDATEEMCSRLIIIPGCSTPESGTVTPARTPPRKKKGKGKGKGKDKRVWSPCPLLPGVPTVPPPHVPQPWELKRSHDITEKEEQKDDIPQRTFAREMQSAGTPPRTAPESVMDITDATEEMCSRLIIIPGCSTPESGTVTPARTPPRKKKGKGKGKGKDKRVWSPCPLLPGVPTVPPPHVPQPWELKRSHATKKGSLQVTSDMGIQGVLEDVLFCPEVPYNLLSVSRMQRAGLTVIFDQHGAFIRKGNKTIMRDITEKEEQKDDIPQRTFAREMQSDAGTTPPRTAPESVMDITDATEEMCSRLIIIPGCSTPESGTVTPARTPPRKKNRRIQFSPTRRILQSTVLPLNLVMAEIEFLGFTPSTTTSTTAPGSGGSAYELDVDFDFMEPGEGSDVDQEETLVDFQIRNVDEYPADSEGFADSSLAEAVHNIDAEADLALRTELDHESDQDLLSFDWQSGMDNFEGVRETFTFPSGPTFNNEDLTPLEIFQKIWDAEIIAHIVQETNRHGDEISRRNEQPNSRLRRWKPVTDDDILKFFAIVMLQSLVQNNVEREYWYPKFDELRIGNFGAIMPYNRFLAIKRSLHFVDNASLPEHPNRLDKIMPIIVWLNDKFSSLYLLEQNIAIDESLLLWKGRLSFSQKIATKKARVGIKSYELCESRTGYLWRMEIYSGKGHVHVAQVGSQEPVEEHEGEYESESATSQIVLSLMKPLFNRGHTVVMDNFYNAPLLSRILKVKHKTDSMGTLRLNREFVPDGLKDKTKKNMKTGEVAFSSTKDLSVVVWMDKKLVAMISTFHQVKVGGIEKYGTYRYKPQVILDYNLSMGGIDHKDQMLHAYPIERVRNMIWYKKLFRRLLNVSIHNAFVLYNHNRTQVLGNREFRLQLAQELLRSCRPEVPPRPLVPAAAPSQMHLPVKNKQSQRCKLCHEAKLRRTTVWRCSTCAVNLCIEGCYTKYHTQ